jgi:hypothetical protein
MRNVELTLTGTRHVAQDVVLEAVETYMDGRLSLADVREYTLIVNKESVDEYVEEDTVQWLVHAVLSQTHHTESAFDVSVVHCPEFDITAFNVAEEIFCPYEEHTHIVLRIKHQQ